MSGQANPVSYGALAKQVFYSSSVGGLGSTIAHSSSTKLQRIVQP